MYEGDQNNLEAQPPEESSNRTFLILAGVLGGLILLSLACLAGYVFLFRSGGPTNTAGAVATQNAQVAFALTATSNAASFPTATSTPFPTQTPVVSLATSTPTLIPVSTQDPSTATVAAAFTLAAQAQLTVVPTSSALPKGGIADEYGAPGLVVVGLALVVVIFLARRLRAAPTR